MPLIQRQALKQPSSAWAMWLWAYHESHSASMGSECWSLPLFFLSSFMEMQNTFVLGVQHHHIFFFFSFLLCWCASLSIKDWPPLVPVWDPRSPLQGAERQQSPTRPMWGLLSSPGHCSQGPHCRPALEFQLTPTAAANPLHAGCGCSCD